MTTAPTYERTRARVETYFDRTATRTWERLTSDAPVSGVRATVRAGRDRMRAVMMAQLPDDLTGLRVLDAGCGTGAMSVELAQRGAQVVGVDISPALIEIAQKRCPASVAGLIEFRAGDMFSPALGQFDHIMAMDSMIYYDASDIAASLGGLRDRLRGSMIFTLAPRTPLLMAMFRVGKLFPRKDRSPTMIPHSAPRIASALRDGSVKGRLREVERVNSGFYISTALEYRP